MFRTTMPKTPINKENDSPLRENNIWFPVKRVMPSPAGKAQGTEKRNHRNFC